MIQVLQARHVFAADGLSERAADYLISVGYYSPIDLEADWAENGYGLFETSRLAMAGSSDSDRELSTEIQYYHLGWGGRLPERHFLLSHKFMGCISLQALALPAAPAIMARVESARHDFVIVNGLSASTADFLIGLGYWPSAVTHTYHENGLEWECMRDRIASSPGCDHAMLEEIKVYCHGWTKVRPGDDEFVRVTDC